MKKFAAIVLFLALLAGAYYVTDQVLSTKADDAIAPMKKYYALPAGTVDVLLVGSSHMGMNVDNRQLWDEYGIASYSLWGGMQPLWNSYYFLKEGLKTQNPRMVMVEVFHAGTDIDYSDQTVAFKHTRALRPSVDWVRNAFASFSTWQKAVEALWGMPYYHQRYAELSTDDLDFNLYTRDMNVNRIALPTDRVAHVKLPDPAEITGEQPLSDKNEVYLRRIIRLCRSENVPLVLLIAPYEATRDEVEKLNRLIAIAAEEGVPTLNYLERWQEIGIDPDCDFYDIGHLQYSGINKLTADIGDYLKAHFDLPDRRLDASHFWNRSDAGGEAQKAGYTMEQQFRGDGVSRMVDTGVKLYDNRYQSWTLLTRIDMRSAGDDGVYLSCFAEDTADYRGLLLRKTRERNATLLLGQRYEVQLPECDEETATVAIVKDIDRYTVYWNGGAVLRDVQLPCDAYPGSLLVGCQELRPGGERFRFSRTRVLNLEVHDRVLSAAEVAAWQPPELPDMPLPLGLYADVPEVIYTLPEQFVGGTDVYPAYVDTGICLYEDTGTRFTLLAELIPTENPGDGVYLSAFAEEPDHYRGLLVRHLTDGALNIVCGNNRSILLPMTPEQPVRLAVVKDADIYTVYINGEKLLDHERIPADPWNGTLLVGAELTADGQVFRRSATQVSSLTVLSGCLSEAALLEWSYEPAAPAQEHKTVLEPVSYAMKDAFLGNGVDRYVDTGISLFDAERDWTLETTVVLQRGSSKGVYLSCFAEQPEIGYRGLLLRQDDADSVTLYLGGLQTWQYELPDNRTRLHLVVTRQGDEYVIAANGAVQARFTSPCVPYDGHLLVGCQQDAAMNLFRFSHAVVDALTVEDGAISPDEAAERSILRETPSRF